MTANITAFAASEFADFANDPLCEISNELLFSNLYTVGVIFTIVANVVGLVGNLFPILCIVQLKTIHANFKILAVHMSAVLVVLCVYQLTRSFYTIANRATPCFFVISARNCFLEDMIQNACEGTCISCMFCIAYERYYALTNHATYEDKSYYMGIVMFVITFGEAVTSIPLYFIFEPYSDQLAYCMSFILYSFAVVMVYIVIDVTMGVCVIVAYVMLHRKSQQLLEDFNHRQSQLSLSSRIQLRRTAEITKSFLPSVILHGLIWMTLEIGIACVNSHPLNVSEVNRHRIAYAIQYPLVSVFSALHPYLVLFLTDPMRKLFVRYVLGPLGCHKYKIGVADTTNSHMSVKRHFMQMKTVWEISGSAAKYQGQTF